METNYFLDKNNWIWDLDSIKKYNNLDTLNKFSCNICYNFTLNIKQCKICKYLLCTNCIGLIKEKSYRKNCPQCFKEIKFYLNIPNSTLIESNKIRVTCILSNLGCNDLFFYEELETHLNNNCKIINSSVYTDTINYPSLLTLNSNTNIVLKFNNTNINSNDLNIISQQQTQFILQGNFIILIKPNINNINTNNTSYMYNNNWDIDYYNELQKYYNNNQYCYNNKTIENGFCIKTYKNNNKYQGFFKNKKRHYFGKLEFTIDNKNSYLGCWENGKTNGYGVFYYDKNHYYEGFFKNNQKEGLGVEVRENSVYIGNFNNNLKNNYGIYLFNNGDKYIGNWLNSNQDGYGEYYYNNGNYFKGNFIKNKFEGYGESLSISKGTYIGEHKNNKKHGKGEFFSTDGIHLKGTWEKNNLLN